METLLPIIAIFAVLALVLGLVLNKRKNSATPSPGKPPSKSSQQPKPHPAYRQQPDQSDQTSSLGGLSTVDLPPGVVLPNRASAVQAVAHKPAEPVQSEESKALTRFKQSFDACKEERPGLLDGAKILVKNGVLTFKTPFSEFELEVQIFLKNAEGTMYFGPGASNFTGVVAATTENGEVQAKIPLAACPNLHHAQVRVYNAAAGVRAITTELPIQLQ